MPIQPTPKTPNALKILTDVDASQCSGSGASHAVRLLGSLGLSPTKPTTEDSEAHHIAWASSGAMSLTGEPDGPPRLISTPLALAAQGAFTVLRMLNPQLDTGFEPGFDAAGLLSERAAIANCQRRGPQSAGGSCRLLATADGCIALNLAREGDWEQLPALLSNNAPDTPIAVNDWQALANNLSRQTTEGLLELAQLLGLAAADASNPLTHRPWCLLLHSAPKQRPPSRQPLVVDLSALWAGPLCASLLGFAGARVIKVESRQRPDGARQGPQDFFDLMNGNKESLALDLQSDSGQARLKKLLRQADIVIESSRPRALRHMGIEAESFVSAKPGMVWLGITGYGRDAEHALRIAYGDDAGVAAGLSQMLYEHYGQYHFCGDAIADPLTGLHAAVAASAAWLGGEGGLLDISLEAVTRFCAQPKYPIDREVTKIQGNWFLAMANGNIPVSPPIARRVRQRAQGLGDSNPKLLQEFSLL